METTSTSSGIKKYLPILNWLPAPKDGFRFAARFYGPYTSLIDASYNMPGIVRVD